jgi:ABC-2 type transport system permease protein
MSALAPSQAARAFRRAQRPGARAAYRVELAKLSEQLAVRLILAVCLLAPPGFALMMRIQSAVPADTLFGRWSGTTGFASSLTVLGFAGSLGLPVLAGVLAGDLFSSEDRHGTWKTLLTRSSTRTDILVGKVAAGAVCAAIGVVVLAVSSFAAGVSLIGSEPLVGLSGQLVSPANASELVLASWAFALLPTLAYVALAMFLSAATRSGIVGVLGPVVVGFAMQLLALVGPGEIVRTILIATPFDAWHGLFTAPAHYGPLLRGAATSVVYIAVFLAAASYVLRRRGFGSSDGMPARRWRLPVRAAFATTAIVAVLIVASGWGPTDISRQRLEAAITPTFERLVLLQARWRADPAGALKPDQVRASCERGGGARASRGPGDDWACSVGVLQPGNTSASLTLDLTVRANGCYTAEGPPAIVGPVLLADARGRTFVNPLYAFDGCFGTT